MNESGALALNGRSGERFNVYFNRPGATIPLYLVRDDMRTARQRLALASAWFSDDEMATAFRISPAQDKLALVSRADLNRKDGYSANAVTILREAVGAVVAVVGTGDYRQGTMHHKFVVADNVVWFGSFNFTFQAKKNFETLARIELSSIADAFWNEALGVVRSQTAQVLTSAPRPTPVTSPSPPRLSVVPAIEQARYRCLDCDKYFDPDVMANVFWSSNTGICQSCENMSYGNAQCVSCGSGQGMCDACGGMVGEWGTGACYCECEDRRVTCMECRS